MKQMMTLLKVVNFPQSEVITDGWPSERPTQPLDVCQHRGPSPFRGGVHDSLCGHDFKQDREHLERLSRSWKVSEIRKTVGVGLHGGPYCLIRLHDLV